MIKILVIQLGGPADLLLSTLLLRCLKKGMPEVELHYLLHHTHADVLATNPYIDHLHQLHFNRQTTLHELKPQNFDLVWDLQTEGAASSWVQDLQARPPKEKPKGWKMFFNQLFASKKVMHPAEQYLQHSSALGIVNDENGLDFFIPKEAEVPYRDIPASHHAGYNMITLTADEEGAWPVEMLQSLCRQIDHPIILMGTKNETTIAEAIQGKEGLKIYNACGKFSIYETADLVRKAKLLISFQPYYIQLGAALKREMVIVNVNRSSTREPYYSKKYLKSQSSLPYESVNISPLVFKLTDRKTTDSKIEIQMEKTLTQLVQSVTKRLRPKV